MDEENNISPTENPMDVKPGITISDVEKCVSQLYGLKGGFLTQLHGFDDLNFHYKPSISCNPFISKLWPEGYIVKIMNSLDSSKNGFCEAQHELLLFLRRHNIRCPRPVQTFRGDYYAIRKFSKDTLNKSNAKKHVIRIFEYLPGTVLKEAPKSYPLLYKLGIFLGKLNEVLKEFSHPVYKTHSSVWHLKSFPVVRFETEILVSTGRKELVEAVVEKFICEVQSKADTFESGVIHGDFNENNVLMTRKDEWEVSAILDFGDSHYSCYLFELAVAMCYIMFECKREGLDMVMGTGHFLAGYLTVRPNVLVDFAVLKICICARICQSLVLGLVAFRKQPENNYVLSTQKLGWQILEEFYEVSEQQVTETWDSVIQSYNIKRQSVPSGEKEGQRTEEKS